MKIKYLIIRFSSIGDIVLTTPVVRGLKKQVKEAEIHYLCKPQYYEILKTNPNVDKVHNLKASLKETIKDLNDEGFDYIIDLQNSLRSKLIKRRLKVLDFTVKKLNIKKWIYVNFKINKLPEKHIVDRYLETVSVFDVEDDGKGLDFFINNEDTRGDAFNLPDNFKKDFIVFAIGGQHNTKKLPKEKIRGVCEKINLPVILLGDKYDRINGEYISAKMENVLNLCGDLSLNQSAEVIKKSKAVITHDTGLMHIAAAFGKNIISVWGNTVPEFGMTPYYPGESSEIVEVKRLKCRPCSKIGKRKCPKNHFKCMENQNTEKIIKLAIKLGSAEKH